MAGRQFDVRRLRLMKAVDQQLKEDFKRLAQQLGRLVLGFADEEGHVQDDRATREAIKSRVWQQVRAYFVGNGDEAFDGPSPRSPFARLLYQGIAEATRIEVERHVDLIKSVVKDREVVEWLIGSRAAPPGSVSLEMAAGARVVEQSQFLAASRLRVGTTTRAFDPVRFRLPDGQIDVSRARAELVKPRGIYDPHHLWVDPAGRRLSDRVWDAARTTRQRIDAFLEYHIARGTSAVQMATELEQYLTPGARGQRTRRPYGVEGSYAARRLARTEITAASHRATVNASIANPFVSGVRWRLSGSHPKIDVCDELAKGGPGRDGIYPPDKVPRVPHPHCLCSQLPVVDKDPSKVVQDLRRQIQAAHQNLPAGERAKALKGLFGPDFLTKTLLDGEFEKVAPPPAPPPPAPTPTIPKPKPAGIWGRERVDVSDLPLARGAPWKDLQNPRFRRERVNIARDEGEGIENLIDPKVVDKLFTLAKDPKMVIDHDETVYFGLSGEKFARLKVGDAFSALGARSTTSDFSRAQQYAGEEGAVFEVTIRRGRVAIPGRVLDVDEIVLLPGAQFIVVEKTPSVTRLELVDDGTRFVEELWLMKEEVAKALAEWKAASKRPAYDLSHGEEIRKKLQEARRENAAQYLQATRQIKELSTALDRRAEEFEKEMKELERRRAKQLDRDQALLRYLEEVRVLTEEREKLTKLADELLVQRRDQARAILSVPVNQRASINFGFKSSWVGDPQALTVQQRVMEAVDFLEDVTANASFSVSIGKDTRGRAWAQGTEIFINGYTQPQIVVHELGHALEETRGAAYRKKRLSFYQNRTKGDKLEKMADLVPNRGYGDSEVTKKDRWINPYMGIVYPDSDEHPASELVSMGVQLLYEDPAKLMDQDPEFFDFIVSYLHGTL